MKAVTERSRAKINLTLDIVGKRDDGYHLLKTVMQTVALSDKLTLRAFPGERSVRVSTNLYYLPTDGRNLAVKAADLFLDEMNIKDHAVDIRIHKRIPVSAGLAGGSTNAAAVLLALNRLFRAGLSKRELMALGLRLGADVPFCLFGGTALAEGIGEKLTPLSPLPPCFLVLCKPRFSVSTARVFSALRLPELTIHPDTAGMIAALSAGDYPGVSQRLYNVLEDVVVAKRQEIASIKATMLDLGADGAMMSGSGPTVFGLFRSLERAQYAERALKRTYRDTILTKPDGRRFLV